MKSLIYLNQYLSKYRLSIAIGLFFVILGNIFALIPANLIGRSFDLITQEIGQAKLNNNLDSLYYSLSIYAILLVLVALTRGVFMFFMRQSIIVASRNMEYDLKNTVFKHYQYLSSSFYQKHDSGDLLNRITEDVSRVRMYLGPAIMYTFNLLTLIALVLSRMLMVSPLLTAIVLVPLPILSFLIYKVSHKINIQSGLVQHKLSNLTNVVQETFSGIRLIKSFVREKQVLNYFKNNSIDYMNLNISLSRTNSIFFPLVLFLVGFSTLLTVYTGGVLAAKNYISIGEVAEFIIYVNMLTWPATSVGWVTEVIQRAAASQSRINNFLSQKDYTIFHSNISPLLKHKIYNHEIRLINLSYQYSNTNILALKDINLDLKINHTIGFVGSVGAGKSTILKILCGILKPSEGKLLFDNIPNEKINWKQLRNDISYVSQDVFLFSDSIRNNILFGVEDISDSELMMVVKQTCLFDELQSFKNGLDTHIGEGGITLSGGQKQRIALARALVRKPKFLFLDDALSSVDSSTELLIINYLQKYFLSTTVFLSSNRLSVLNYCDSIIVLKSGKIIQKGNHNSLIKLKGEYRKLFFNQMDN